MLRKDEDNDLKFHLQWNGVDKSANGDGSRKQ